MKKVLLLPAAVLLFAGCASYYGNERAAVDSSGNVVYEPSGAQTDPNPNWDVNARDIRQRPYGAAGYGPWNGAASWSSVAPSTDSDKNMAPHIRSENELP